MSTKKLLNGLLVLSLALSLALFVGSAMPASADHDDAPPALPANERLDPDDTPGFDVDPAARRIELLQIARQHTGENKVLFSGIGPNQVVAHYVVEGTGTPLFNEWGMPNGLLAGSQPGTADGKPVEFFASVSDTSEGAAAKVHNFFLWTEQDGWTLLESVIAVPSTTDKVF